MPSIGSLCPKRLLWFSAVMTLIFHHTNISAYKWPSPKYDALEEKLYQGGTLFTSFFDKAECRRRRPPKASVAGEWIQSVRAPIFFE
jgi:hypothetical protein